MRVSRTEFLPATRVFEEERARLEAVAGFAGYSKADLVRAALGFETERLSGGKGFDCWSLSDAGILLYNGKRWRGDVAALLNGRCVESKP